MRRERRRYSPAARRRSFSLSAAHGPGGAAESALARVFHFHEHEGLAIPGDDIQFAAARALVKVARHDGEALPAQEAVRQILAAAAVRLFRRGVPRSVPVASGVRQAVQRINYR